MAKPTYIVSDMALKLRADENSAVVEYKSERAAIAAGKELLQTTTNDEVWVWKLSHIISRPQVEPNIEVVE